MATQVRKDKVQVEIEINGVKRSGKNIRELQSIYRSLNNELKEIPINSEEYRQKLEETRSVKKILDEQRLALRSVGSEAKNLSSAGAQVKNFFKGIGTAAVAFLAVDRIKDFFSTLTTKAKEIQGVQRRFDVVFGDSADAVEDFGKRSASALGLSQQEFRKAAAAAGDLLIPMGFTREETANLTTELVSVSGALSEWTSGQFSSAETSEILTKALLGEREQLKQLGISILESDVQTRLAEKGQKQYTGTALEQAKALATLEIITEKSADARSTFASQTTNIAREEAKLTATYENQFDRLANRLAPAYASLLRGVNNLIGASNEYSKQLETERTDLNLLVQRIGRLNEENEDRSKLIGELQSQYPSFLGNLNAENVTNQQLRDRLKEVNAQYINRIILQQQQEEIEKQAQALASERISAAEAELALEEELRKAKERFNIEVEAGLSLEEELKEVRRQISEQRGFGGILTAEGQALLSLGAAYADYAKSVNRAGDEEEDLLELQERREAITKRLGTSIEELDQQLGTASPVSASIEVTATGPSKKSQEASRKVAEERLKQEEALNQKIQDLQISLIRDNLERRIAEINVAADREIDALEGSADQIAKATTLINEKRNRSLTQAQTEYEEEQAAQREKFAQDEIAAQQAYANQQLDNLDAYHQDRIAEITRATLEEAQAGNFASQEEAQAAMQARLLEELKQYLEDRIRLMKQYGIDASELETQLDELNLNNLFKDPEGGDPGNDWLTKLKTISQAAGQVFNELYSLQEARAETAYENQISSLEKAQAEELSRRGLTESQREAIEKKYAARREQIDIQYRKKEKQRAITQSLINTALASSQALATPPAPNIPASILAGVLGGIQTAAIAAKNYEKGGKLPEAGKGGMSQGPRHGEGGVKLVDTNSGQYLGEIEGGEAILSRAFVKNNPELTERALFSSQYMGGARIYADGGILTNVSTTPSSQTIDRAAEFNDSNIVAELKLTRKAISRLSLRIGEAEAYKIMEMGNEYVSAKNQTAI